MKVLLKVNTFSIVAFDPTDQCWGVAVASKFLAVGALVPYAKANVGAIATQSSVNTSYGTNGLELLSKGYTAPKVLTLLLKQDKMHDDRQVGIIDRWGNVANFTGDNCSQWAGGIRGTNISAQGNLLYGKKTLSKMVQAFRNEDGKLERKLYAALVAGELAGGDKRGKQSASMLVVKEGGSYGGHSDRYLDLRVDNNPDPIGELGKLLDLHRIFLGSSKSDEKIEIDDKLTLEFQNLLRRIGYYWGPLNGEWNKATKEAFYRFLDTENLEQRVDIDMRIIDLPALQYIRSNF